MPIGYGSNIKPPMLSPSEVGRFEEGQQEQNTLWLNIVDWFTIVAEVAIGFIPGVGAVADTAIAAAGAGIRTGVKSASGQTLSALDVGLDFGTAAIPGVLSGFKGIKTGINNFRLSLSIERKGERVYNLAESTVEKAIIKQIKNPKLVNAAPKQGEILLEQSGGSRFILGQHVKGEYLKDIGYRSGFLNSPKSVAKNYFPNQIIESKISSIIPSGLPIIGRGTLSTSRGILEGAATSSRKSANIQAEAEALGKTLARDFEISFSQFKRLSTLLRNTPRAERVELLIQELKALGKSIENIETIMKQSQNVIRTFGKFSNNYNTSLALRQAANTQVRRLFKGLQYVSNPTTIVSKVVEKTIGKAASRIEEGVKITLKKISGIIRKGAKGAKEMEEQWVRTGGLRMSNKNSAVYGIKIINQTPALFTVLVKFDPWETGGKTGKNVGGKKDVIISMSPLVLKQFIQHVHPMKMYLDTWARSRGGRKAGGILNEDVIGYVEELVGFLHIDQIGEYVGMVSYMKNTFRPGNQTHFIWTGNFYTDLVKQLIQTIPQESIKLVAAMFPGRLGKTFSEKAIKGAIFNNQSIFKSIRSQATSEGQRMRGEKGSGKAFEKIQSIKGIGGSISGLR